MIEAWQLRDEFDITLETARNKLSRDKKQGLVIKLTPDRWELTVEGYSKLEYYDKKQDSKTTQRKTTSGQLTKGS